MGRRGYVYLTFYDTVVKPGGWKGLKCRFCSTEVSWKKHAFIKHFTQCPNAPSNLHEGAKLQLEDLDSKRLKTLAPAYRNRVSKKPQVKQPQLKKPLPRETLEGMGETSEGHVPMAELADAGQQQKAGRVPGVERERGLQALADSLAFIECNPLYFGKSVRSNAPPLLRQALAEAHKKKYTQPTMDRYMRAKEDDHAVVGPMRGLGRST